MVKLCLGTGGEVQKKVPRSRRARFSLTSFSAVVTIGVILVIAALPAGAAGSLPQPLAASNSGTATASLTPGGAALFSNGILKGPTSGPALQAGPQIKLGPASGPDVVLTQYGRKLWSEGVLETASASPDSHSGCNGNTCIDVYGSGETVAGWDTYASLGSGVCGYAYFYIDGGLYAYSNNCYRGNTPKIYAPGTPFTFKGTADHQLCNEWSPGGTGYPCATVHP